jgi:hypothetical protein
VDSAKATVVDTTAENFANPTNSLEGSVQKLHQEPMEALVSESAENSVPSPVSEHATGNTTKVHTAVERGESTPKVGFPLSVILWCAWACSSSRN